MLNNTEVTYADAEREQSHTQSHTCSGGKLDQRFGIMRVERLQYMRQVAHNYQLAYQIGIPAMRHTTNDQ